MRRPAVRIAVPALIVALLAAGAWLARPGAARTGDAAQAVACRRQTIAGAGYRVCEIPAAQLGRLQLVARDGGGRPVRTIARLDSLVRARGERLLFATNAGLYERVDSATGLLVADGGRTYSRLNRGAGPASPCAVANFYCPPNGVFFVAGGTAGVLSTADFARRAGAPRLATQSGPMLVRRGTLARAFPPDSRSRLVRNGVGVRADGTVVFAIADQGASFHQFAAAFRDALRCPDALFLDGTISQLYAGPGARLPPPRREFAAIFAVTEGSTGR